ncbi:MAG: glycosyltransferase family 4 protein [Pirellulales bacterium]|nr:glycosyltransferase family 4 protein [Pirellulales bacterium]
MRIVYLTAGAASRYCGSCLHDNTLAKALSQLGEHVLLTPTYTPLRTDEEDVSLNRIFFGGVNVYLQQHLSLFRHTPWFVDRLLDSPRLLRWLSQRSAGMAAAKLGPLTVSTLEGERGRQRKEIEKLIRWLESEARPDIIHLSNALLLGIAPSLKKRLGVPIACGLAGEDLFLEQLEDPHYTRSRELLRKHAQEADVFVAYNRYFGNFMADYLGIDPGHIEVIRHGLHLDGHSMKPLRSIDKHFTIGYFGRIAPEKGPHLLLEAFSQLCADPSLPPLKLKFAGYRSAADEAYFQTIIDRVQVLSLQDRFEYVGELDRHGKIAFLQSLDVMSIPTIYQESKGLSALEALANGVPVVLPAHGAFPELIELTGAGLLCEPGNPHDLASKVRELILNSTAAAALGRRGHDAIRSHYTAAQMAEGHRTLYRRLIEGDCQHSVFMAAKPGQSA